MVHFRLWIPHIYTNGETKQSKKLNERVPHASPSPDRDLRQIDRLLAYLCCKASVDGPFVAGLDV